MYGTKSRKHFSNIFLEILFFFYKKETGGIVLIVITDVFITCKVFHLYKSRGLKCVCVGTCVHAQFITLKVTAGKKN